MILIPSEWNRILSIQCSMLKEKKKVSEKDVSGVSSIQFMWVYKGHYPPFILQ